MLALASAASFGCTKPDSSTRDARIASGRSWPTPPLEAVDGGLVAEKLPRIGYRGGPFLRNPRIVTITSTRDDPAIVARVERFGSAITHTPWWRTVVDSYCKKPDDCVGEGRASAEVHVLEAFGKETTVVDVADFLAREAKARHLGDLDGDTLLVFYLPAGVGLRDADVRYCGTEGVRGPRATHRVLTLGARRIPYAVLPRCGDDATLTSTASHEILEATTNPDPASRGFAFEQGSANLSFIMAGAEAVDPCGLVTVDGHWTFESGFAVQRAWSNRAAAGGHDPCVPAAADRPYLALVPRQPVARLVAVGDTLSIPLDAVADRAVDGWTISAFDLDGEREHTTYVEAKLDRAHVEAGESALVTLSLKQRHPSGTSVVGLVSTRGVHSSMWPLAVMMR